MPPAAPATVSVAVALESLGGDVEPMVSGIGLSHKSPNDLPSWYERPRRFVQNQRVVTLGGVDYYLRPSAASFTMPLGSYTFQVS